MRVIAEGKKVISEARTEKKDDVRQNEAVIGLQCMTSTGFWGFI